MSTTQPVLKGIIPPLITPLRDRDALDIPALERLIDRVISGGLHGVFLLGTSGEGPNLSYRLRRELIERACRHVRGRIPVLVGVTDTSLAEAVGIARISADAGATAVVASTPYYFPLGQPELVDYVEHFVPQLPLPLVLYSIPGMTRTNFEIDTLRRLIQLPRIIGIKDSSGNMDYFLQLVELAKHRPDWRLFIGWDHLLVDALRRGAHGGVNGAAQVAPKLYVELYDAAASGNWDRVSQLQKPIATLNEIYSAAPFASGFVKGMKCALSLLGICGELMTEPFSTCTPEQREKVRAVLLQIGLIG